MTKLVTDQGPVYAEMCLLADTWQLDLSSVGNKLKFPGATVEESARIALENMRVLNDCALECAKKIEAAGGLLPPRNWKRAARNWKRLCRPPHRRSRQSIT